MRYKRIVILGGASPYWAPRNVGFMACSRSMREAEVLLVDISLERSQAMAETINKMVARAYPGTGLRVTASATLDEALPGAEAVFACYRNGGHNVESRINEVAESHGSRQCCFTAGPAAIIYLAVQGPVMVDLVRKMQRHCPQAWFINCSNPLPAMCMLAAKAGHDPRRVLGFCGALHWTRTNLARFLQVEPQRLEFRIGGTNHCTFITEVRIDGKDAYPRILERARKQPYFDMGIWGRSTTEIRILNAVGYLCPGGHTTDIFPTLPGKWMAPTQEALASEEAGAKLEYSADFPKILADYIAGRDAAWHPASTPDVPVTWLDALAGEGEDNRFSINTANLGTVPNLPDWTVPDLECILDKNGVTPVPSAPLPEVIAEVVRRHQLTFELAARAVLHRDPQLLKQAVQICPFGDYLESADAILSDAREEFGPELVF